MKRFMMVNVLPNVSACVLQRIYAKSAESSLQRDAVRIQITF